ncbi:netrin unc-6-like [Choristoneura fumiferana]|uniref:netrin unc-6-like n=1 Tax=Choristoneura fumiferana TaxID=7141 RepID=UPI003D15DA4E
MCDPETGVCIDCQDNTAGYNCEECKPGYERDAYQQCVPSRTVPSSCNCDPRGEAEPCDDQDNCRCKPT